MRKILLLTLVTLFALIAALPPKPAEALPAYCGCWCVSYPKAQCKRGTIWVSCLTYASEFC